MSVIGYKYRIYPNKIQQQFFQQMFGSCRFVYNYFLEKSSENYKTSKEKFSFTSCCKELTLLKNQYLWLKDCDAVALQQSLRDLEKSYHRFFNKISKFPKFHSKKNRKQSYRTVNNSIRSIIRIQDNFIRLPKVGFVKAKISRKHQGNILNAVISQNNDGKYYCSICCTDVNFTPFPNTGNNIGIDLGIVDFAITSDGTKIPNLRFYENAQGKIAKLQNDLSRKTIGSNRWNKARIKLAKAHKHIVNQRLDFLHKLTTKLAKEYDIICIEDLDIKNMKETNNSSHNKRVVDVSWYEFRTMLQYKTQWYGKQLVIINRFYPSSQICHICNFNSGKKEVTVRHWECPHCHNELDRDINAAINILNEGLHSIVK